MSATASRIKGHALTHLTYRPNVGWVWACECGYKPISCAGTTGIARTEHREHKERLNTPAEHATAQIWRTTTGLHARCVCGHPLGPSATIDATRDAHREHRDAAEQAEPVPA